MTLVEAIEKASDNDVLQRSYTIDGGYGFTKWGRVEVNEHGRFFIVGWDAIKLDDLKAENWEIIS